MPITIYNDADADLGLIQKKRVAVIGYGNQGHAHALNLRDSAVEVVVGLNPSSASLQKARDANLDVMNIEDASRWADVVMLLVPDEVASVVYKTQIAPFMQPGDTLMVSHGFNIHFKKITVPDSIAVSMVAPKGAGYAVRQQYLLGSGVPCLIAVAQEGSNEGLNHKATGLSASGMLALSYAKALGGTRSGVLLTSFREETETDLFSEQAILCGGLIALIKAGFETLVNAGYSEAMAYFECLHEVKLIADLFHQKGLAGMNQAISNTAEYGGYVVGNEIIGSETRAAMSKVLKRIQSGEFANELLYEMNENHGTRFRALRHEEAQHPIEVIGRYLRGHMNLAPLKTPAPL